VSYQLNRVHLLICIFAGLVLTCGFVWHLFFGLRFELFTMSLWVSFAIVFFYFVGHIVRSILINRIFVPGAGDYDFSEDEEYQKFLESLESSGESPSDLMSEEPLELDEISMHDGESEELEEVSYADDAS
jgi:hypothetical protein